MRRRPFAVVPALLLAVAAVVLPAAGPAAPAHASPGPRVCTGQPGQPPDILRGDGLRKLSVCVNIDFGGDFVEAVVTEHSYRKSGTSWISVTSQSVTLNWAFLWKKDSSTVWFPVVTYGQDYNTQSCRKNAWNGPLGCSTPNVARMEYWSEVELIQSGKGYGVGDPLDGASDPVEVSWRDDQGFPHFASVAMFSGWKTLT